MQFTVEPLDNPVYTLLNVTLFSFKSQTLKVSLVICFTDCVIKVTPIKTINKGLPKVKQRCTSLLDGASF